MHGCRDCDLLPACQRCHATALHEGGDYLGPYPSACERARTRYAASAGALEVIAPSEDCEAGRDPAVGPYAIVAPGVIRPLRDVRTDADEALAAKFGWLRAGGAKPAVSGLVTIGRKPSPVPLQPSAAEPCSVPQVDRV